jgi:hypothetical protein
MSNQKQYFLITDKEIEKMFSSISAAQAYFFAQAQTARNSNESKMFRDLYNGMSEVHDELNPFNRKIINAKSTVEQTRKDLVEDILSVLRHSEPQNLLISLMSKIEKYEIIGKEQKFPDDQDNLPF